MSRGVAKLKSYSGGIYRSAIHGGENLNMLGKSLKPDECIQQIVQNMEKFTYKLKLFCPHVDQKRTNIVLQGNKKLPRLSA